VVDRKIGSRSRIEVMRRWDGSFDGREGFRTVNRN
jgi:hypothetical protein